MKEKKNPNKFSRECEERELAKAVIKHVQDNTQELDQEVEEVIRLGRYSEWGRRPMKVRMRSQVAVEEIMGRKGKLADDTEHKDIWIKKRYKPNRRDIITGGETGRIKGEEEC
ncbi:hypothetical protein E2C01_053196 [Portunus trituberculatus]|uniref:Uncharacterized protein n=1 Tax=Portunus trituberculatus TaxID=210409 RepID=A0A5B7GFS1_PORTR|nr:hypothetical protein [Portunus trituberculatus]